MDFVETTYLKMLPFFEAIDYHNHLFVMYIIVDLCRPKFLRIIWYLIPKVIQFQRQ